MKSAPRHRHNDADRAFRKAWKLLGRLEHRLVLARAEEERRARQLDEATGRKAARRLAQLEAAQSEIAQVEGLLTELSSLIAATAQTQSGRLVQDMAREVAASIKADASAEPDGWPDGTPSAGRGSIRSRASDATALSAATTRRRRAAAPTPPET